jgi:Tfp pilus assembly protein PilF
VSLILDALRRRSSEHESSDPYVQTARADSVLRTLGFPLGQHSRIPPFKTVVLYGGSAVAVGFVGISLLILFVAPPATQSGRAPVATTSQARARPSPVAQGHPADAAPPTGAQSRGASPIGASPSISEAPDKPPSPAQSESRSVTPAETASEDEPPRSGSRFEALTTSDHGEGVHRGAPSQGSSSRQPPARVEPVAAVGPSRSLGGPPAEDHFGLALYYQGIGDFESALAHYRLLLEQHDTSAEVHNNLGLLYEGHGQVDDAVKQFQRAIAINPNYVKAHNNLGVTMMRANQLDAAAAELRVALTADPRNVESLVNLALVQRAAGRVGQARELLRRALVIDPRNAGSHYNLAVLADESGDVPTAVEHYLAFLRLGGVDHAELTPQVRARLVALGS